MSLMSMTGYGDGEVRRDGLHVEVEAGSVNRRQFEARVSLPRHLSVLEARIIEAIQKRVARGAINCTVRVTAVHGGSGPVIDKALATRYIGAIRKAGKELGLEDDCTTSMLMELPGVVSGGSDETETEKVWKLIRQALDKAVGGMIVMRKREGAHLRRDLVHRLDCLRRSHAVIRQLAPTVRERYAGDLQQRLSRVNVPVDPSDERFLKELALFAERCDITEEVVRLESHFAQAEKMLAASEPSGRPLDFLCQEMFREINTIGSKANDARLSVLVVEFKTQLERLREQVQNVE